MPSSVNATQGLGNLLAYPVEAGGIDQQRLQNWAVTQQMLQYLAQPPPGAAAGAAPPLTPEQIGQINPRPAPSMWPSLVDTSQHPIAGTALRGVGALGQMLQILSGGRSGGPAPRPPGVKDLLEMRRTESLDVFRRQQAEEATKYRQDTLGERKRHDLVTEGKGGAGGKFPTREEIVAIAAGVRKHPTLTPEQAQSILDKEGSAGAAITPGPERDLEQEAERRIKGGFLQQADSYEWKQTQRVENKRQLATSLAEVKDNFRALNTEGQKTVRQLHGLHSMATYMRELLADPEVRANRGVFWGRVSQWLYNQGFTEGPEKDGYVAAQNFVRILGTTPFTSGSRNFAYIQQIQQHLAAAQDQPGLLYSKLDLVDRYADELELGILDAAQPIEKQRRALTDRQRGGPGGDGPMGPMPDPGTQGPGGSPDEVEQRLRSKHF